MQMKFEKRRMSEKRTSVRTKSEHYRTALSRDPGFEKQKGPLSSSAWKANARPNRIPRGERGSEKTLIAEERLGGAFVACNSRRSHCGATGERRPQKKKKVSRESRKNYRILLSSRDGGPPIIGPPFSSDVDMRWFTVTESSARYFTAV